MSVKFINCVSGDGIKPHAIYRLTFVPSNAVVSAINDVLGTWPHSCDALFDAMAGQSLLPAQGAPTVIDDPAAGKACVFDTVANWPQADGQTVQQVATVLNALTVPCDCAAVELLTADAAVADAAVNQATSGMEIAKTVQADSVFAQIGTVGKWVVVGLALVVVLVLANGAKKIVAA